MTRYYFAQRRYYITFLFRHSYTLIRPIACCCISTFAHEADRENTLSPKSHDITTIQCRCRKSTGSNVMVLQRMKPHVWIVATRAAAKFGLGIYAKLAMRRKADYRVASFSTIIRDRRHRWRRTARPRSLAFTRIYLTQGKWRPKQTKTSPPYTFRKTSCFAIC